MNSDIIVLDDFLPKSFVERYQKKVQSDDFTWFYLDDITRDVTPRQYKCNDVEWKDTEGLSHSVFYDNQWFTPYWCLQASLFICEMAAHVSSLEYDRLYRMKVNQILQKSSEHINVPHIDSPRAHTVLLYYVNDSDGDTILYDKLWDPSHDNTTVDLNVLQRVSPKAGRAVIFNGLRYHSSSNPVQHKKRIALNINLGLGNGQ